MWLFLISTKITLKKQQVIVQTVVQLSATDSSLGQLKVIEIGTIRNKALVERNSKQNSGIKNYISLRRNINHTLTPLQDSRQCSNFHYWVCKKIIEKHFYWMWINLLEVNKFHLLIATSQGKSTWHTFKLQLH